MGRYWRFADFLVFLVPVSYTHLDVYKRQVQANTHGVDTTGFFDEVAVAIGRNLTVLKEVLERIRWAQQKEYSSTTIQLGKKSEEEKRAISALSLIHI